MEGSQRSTVKCIGNRTEVQWREADARWDNPLNEELAELLLRDVCGMHIPNDAIHCYGTNTVRKQEREIQELTSGR
jgi:hypothetical protein